MKTRRQFLRDLGISTGALPFISGLSSLHAAENAIPAKRVIFMFSPNGTVPDEFWPSTFGDGQMLAFGPMLKPLEPFKDRILMLRGVHNKIRGDGDNHMRGMSCLLTARELNAGNIQGGGNTPAGWASGISIDQEIANYFHSNAPTKTRFSSLEFGVAVPDRADPWTRMSYAGNNKPIAPIDDPAQMFDKLYGGVRDRDDLVSILDPLREDLKKVSAKVSPEDRALLEEHMQLVRQLEAELKSAGENSTLDHAEPDIDPEIELVNDNTPQISRLQIDLLVNSMANDMTRVASLQFMRSVGQARMRWLGIDDGHHSLSHEPDSNQQAREKLHKINHWFAGELAYLAEKLQNTPEPGAAGGSMLDHTQVVWLNELGKGNNHTLNDIPFLLLGGGAGFKVGRALDFGGQPHNRLWLSLAHGLGHRDLTEFGNSELSAAGPLDLA